MNTFLLSNNYRQTARCLDIERLNRQIVECVHVAKALVLYETAREKFNRQIPFGVIFPPVIKLWMLDDDTLLLPELKQYFDEMCIEWRRLRGKDHRSSLTFNWDSVMSWQAKEDLRNGVRPFTLEWPAITYSSNYRRLTQKDPTHYGNVFQREGIPPLEDGIGYPWVNPVVIRCEVE